MFVMAHTFLNQPIGNLKYYPKKYPRLILISFWIICSTILSLSFKSLLLRTYFERRPTLTVNTLDELISMPELSIAGRQSVNELKYLRPDLHKTLKDRVNRYETKMAINTRMSGKQLINEKLIKDMIERKAVFLTTTHSATLLKSIYTDSSLKESDNKYNAHYRYSYVHKECPHKEAIFNL